MASMSQKAATQGHIQKQWYLHGWWWKVWRTKGRHPKVHYKLKVCKNPAAQNMPHEEEYDDNNYKSIDETAV